LIYSNVNLRARPAVLDRRGLKGIDYDRAERFMEKYRGKLSKIVTKIPLPPGVAPEQLGGCLLHEAISGGFMAGGPGFEPGLTESESLPRGR
jgi:hypothetical protein